ncbi:MAG: SGNH/GDSL hydrolase family protein [Nitrospira sp.]|nr:SGNH/GDSL hydrolase family protein [Nitrospira sp.]
MRINSQGWRDREHDLSKQPGIIQVAVLGDSYVEAFQVPEDQTFWAVLEANLASCYAKQARSLKPEVLSFGASGYGTAQELLVLRHKVWTYNPDIVLLAVTTGNDIRNNSRWLESDKLRPFFFYQGEELIKDDSFHEPVLRKSNSVWRRVVVRLSDHSRVLQVAIEAYVRVRDAIASGGKRAGIGELGLDDEVYRQPITAEWKDAWKVTEGLISIMHREVTQQGKKILGRYAFERGSVNNCVTGFSLTSASDRRTGS